MMAFAKAMKSSSLKEIRMKVKGLEKKAPPQVSILEAIQDPLHHPQSKG